MEKLTEKEEQIYRFIGDFNRKNGYPPSVRDIQSGLSIRSTSTVHSYINKLTEKGALNKSSGKSRGLRTEDIDPSQKNHTRIPMIGRVTAGQPILAVENIRGYLDFPLLKKSARDNSTTLFALRVSGESMIEAGIMDGDIVVVRKQSAVDNGEIVVALVEDGATVKAFYKEDGHFRLQPRNSTMDPIIVDECTIIGKVISVMRFYD